MGKPKKPLGYAEQLSRTELFRGMNAETLAPLLSRPEIYIRCFQPGEAMRCPGELGILISGRARVTKEAGSGQVIISVLEPSTLFGAAGLLLAEDSPQPAPTAITAWGRCRAALIPQETLLELLSQHPLLMRNYLSYLTGRIRFLNRRMGGLLTGTAQQRLYGYLKEQCRAGTWKPPGMTELAKRLSISRASLYRGLDELERDKKIHRGEDHSITLLQEDIR